ncbi:hypothetical protein [Mesorhizobium amorphae]|uniref:hypothetical protein n=1 Tax=Mesorhizobium amorphae TaxID=71433 RepID=UPI001184651A|nr:hypothetical protein [Mesorhizobium amorphae]
MAIGGNQPVAKDFQSFAERGRAGIDLSNCQSWGLSVWPDLEAVAHGRDAIPHFRTKKVIRFSVTPDDGTLRYTPSKQQPDHHTFWKAAGCSLLNACEIVLEPEAVA